MNHLRSYIGLYLTALILPFMFGYGVSEEHPIWVWWITFALIILKTPPYSISDRFWGAYTRLVEKILTPLLSRVKTWPWWVRGIFVIAILYFMEEVFLSSLGYTMLPWRMDFSG
jgi:hypothetical protein